MRRRTPLAVSLLLVAAAAARPQEPILPPGDKEPILRLEAGGPTSFVTALAFSPDGKTLYAAGYDKVVRVWALQKEGFVLDRASYRVPVGPGLNGAINALALSPDGRWLAVGGLGIVRGGAGFRAPGLVVPKVGGMTADMWKDEGTVYVFNTTNPGDVRILRGHRGPVLALAFAPRRAGKPPLLASFAQEWDDGGNRGGVARLWDVSKEKDNQLGVAPGQPDPEKSDAMRPGLAVWHAGKGPTEVRVAFALNDATLRVWQVEKERVREIEEGGKYNVALFALPGAEGRLWTGSFRGTTGQLQATDVPDGQDAEVARRVDFAPPERGVYLVPRALAPFSSEAGGKLDRAAVVLRALSAGDRDKEYLLQVADLARGRAEGAPLLLWKGGANLPLVAAAPGGDHLAVAGNDFHEIHVYAVADVLAGRNTFQTLKSAGAARRFVAFVRNGTGLGLLLNAGPKADLGGTPRGLGRGDVVFDFAGRALTSDTDGWKTDAPDLRGWEATLAAEKGEAPVVTVRHDGKLVRRLALKAGDVIDDYALLPGKVPLLAVAFREKTEPRLFLYDLAGGAQLRQWTGHTDRIRAVAFSADGKLLASTSEDQTVRVWTLAQLDKILGRHGMVQGVAVKPGKGGAPAVASVDPAAPAAGKLEKDEVIEGIVDGKELKPLASPRAYYEAIADVRPGKDVTLRVRAGAKVRDVVLRVGQGTDDRKPLLSLFLARAGAAGAAEWVGWSPYGPYEASDRKAERHIGWHFNTGDPKAPAAFALADQYRKGNYREGILKHLVSEGDLDPALRAWEKEEKKKPAPVPHLGVELDDQGPPFRTDEKGQILVRDPHRLRVSIDNGFPDERVGAVQWQFDKGAAQPLARTPDGLWEADVSKAAWRRGTHTIRVVLSTREERPKEYAQELTLRYQPPAPALDFDPAWWKKHFGAADPRGPQALVVRDGPRFTIEAAALPGLAGEDAKVSLRVGDKAAADLGHTDGKELAVKKEIELQKGENVVELVAANGAAPRGEEAVETTRRTLRITYQPDEAKAAPPQVVIRTVEPVRPPSDEGATPDAALTVEAGRTVVVGSKRVRVRGTISASEDLTEATLDGKALADLRTGPRKKLEVDQEVTLQPGKQELRFRAKTKGGEAAVTVPVEYRPPLPRVVWLSPDASRDYVAGQDQREVALSGRLRQPGDPQPVEAVLLVNGEPVAGALALDKDKGTLSAKVALKDGDNRVQVRLTNRWGAATGGPLLLRYLRPPHDIAFAEPRTDPARALTDLTATVVSPSELLPDTIDATINGRTMRPAEVARVKPGGDAWTITFKDVALDVGDNEARLEVSNRDAACRLPGVLKFAFKGKPVAPPEVKIVEPAENVNVTEPELALRFVVRSATPLKRVELVRGGAVPFRQPFDVSGLKADARGTFELKVSARLSAGKGADGVRPAVDVGKLKSGADGFRDVALDARLAPKANALRVEAVNDGGEQSAALIVNYLAMPVRLVFDELREAGKPPLKPEVRPEGKVLFQAAAQGRVSLRGRVLWDKSGDERLKGVSRVRVYVNGFQQPSATLEAASGAGRAREFKTDVLLNRAKDNLVEVELPDEPQESGNRPSFRVACEAPARTKRVHLLVVSIEEKDEKALTEQALEALKPAAGIEVVPHVLSGYVTPSQVYTQLRLIMRTTERLATKGSPNDVIMVYYQGVESLDARGHYFRTSVAGSDDNARRAAVSCDGLAKLFDELLGAKLLLLDVSRPRPAEGQVRDRVVSWPEEVRTGVFRSAWLTKGEEPGDVRLLTTWEKTTPLAKRLKDVDTGIEALVSGWSKKHPDEVKYNRYLPACLADLPISRQ